MTTDVTQTEFTYTGDDSKTSWDFVFPVTIADGIVAADSVAVYVALDDALSSTPVDSSLYTVTYDEDSESGSVEYPLSGSPLTTSDKISVVRETPSKQPFDIKNQIKIKGESLEGGLDNNNNQVQEIANEMKRTVKVDVTSDSTPEELLRDISDAVVDSAASAAAAATSESNAATSETNAATSADEAAASAASIDLPTPEADTFLYQPTAVDGYETKTVTQTKTILGVDTNATNIATNTSDITTLDGKVLPAGGTTDQVLTKQSGTDYDADWEDLSTFVPQVEYITSSATHNAPAGATKMEIELHGAGGGGGGADSGNGQNGSSGGNSVITYSAVTLTAGGGVYGEGDYSISASGGAGGSATGGDVNIIGGAGGDAGESDHAGGDGGNIGGVAGHGENGEAVSKYTPGVGGAGAGAGGGGASAESTNDSGGAGGGAGGCVIKYDSAANLTVTIGAGGAGGADSVDGGDGSDGIAVVRWY